MSLILNEGTQGPSSGDLMSMSEETTTTSAFTRVSHSVGVVPVTASLREETTPTPASSTASDSPPTLRRPPLENDEEDDDEDDRDRHDTSSNQGDNAFAWPSHTSYDEQRQLLGTEEESSDHATSEEEELMMENFPVSAGAASNTASGITASSMMMVTSSGKRSVWSITREQINYYTTQFFCLQSDPKGVIPGAEAKEFFERSKLPITELRKIWQLSDVSQDGCLSLEEFLTAMHLVVLKRNTIELPETLPPVLRPAYLKQRLTKRNKLMILQPPVTNPNKDLYNGGNQNQDHQASVTPISNLEIESGHERLLTDEVDATTKKSLKSEEKSEDSVSVISSPGRPAPVNFDFHRPDARRDPTIVQPVAVRLSPDSPVVQSSDLDEEEDQLPRHHHHPRRKASRGEVGYEKLWNAAGKDDQEDDDDEENDKLHPGDNLLHESGPVSLPASRLTKKEPSPPPPPPRGSNSYTRSHARSSSLDLNNIQGVHPRPPLPPRLDPSAPTASTRLTRDCRALQCKIQEYREKNSVVARTNNELHQEVSDALEERIALEYQLEQLKSFGDE